MAKSKDVTEEAFERLDMEAELKAAMEAEMTGKPVRAKKRKGEPTGVMPPKAGEVVPASLAPVVLPAAEPLVAPAVAPMAASAALPAAQPTVAPVVQPAVAPVVLPEASETPRETPGEPEEAMLPPRQAAVLLTRQGRRPEGYDLPREDRRRRVVLTCAPRVLGPGESFRFEMVAPDQMAVFELRAFRLPTFGSPRLLIDALLLEDFPLLRSMSAEEFTPAAAMRGETTPFAVLAPGSVLTAMIRNVSPTPVPVHPSAILAILEPRQGG